MCSEIIYNVLDELRKERKIIMVLNNENVDEYIDLNITNIDLDSMDKDKELDSNTKYAC